MVLMLHVVARGLLQEQQDGSDLMANTRMQVSDMHEQRCETCGHCIGTDCSERIECDLLPVCRDWIRNDIMEVVGCASWKRREGSRNERIHGTS